MLQKIWKIAKTILFVSLLCGTILLLTKVLMPKIPDFYKEEEWDVVFFGTSQSYCTFDPAVFDEYELKTYNRGRSQQTMNYTYYYVKDALEVSQIDVVVLEIYGMVYEEGNPCFLEAGVRDSSMNDFRASEIKLEAVKDCVPEDLWLGYMLPLDKYHTNWENMDYTSPETLWNDLANPYYTEESDRGYFRWESAQPSGYAAWESIFDDRREEVFEENMKYLEGIYELCQEHGARLVLVRAPFPCNEKTVAVTNTIEDWAVAHDVELINYMKITDVIGMDFSTDSLDGGTHLYASGAAKVSRYLAEYLVEE